MRFGPRLTARKNRGAPSPSGETTEPDGAGTTEIPRGGPDTGESVGSGALVDEAGGGGARPGTDLGLGEPGQGDGPEPEDSGAGEPGQGHEAGPEEPGAGHDGLTGPGAGGAVLAEPVPGDQPTNGQAGSGASPDGAVAGDHGLAEAAGADGPVKAPNSDQLVEAPGDGQPAEPATARMTRVDRAKELPAVRTVRRWGAVVARVSWLWRPGPGVREAADPGGRAFALVTAMPAIMLAAWLVPGLALLLAHAFLPAPMVLISVPLAVALAILVARQIPGRWPAPGAGERATPGRGRSWPAWWGLGGSVVIAAGFAAWQLLENSPQFIVSRDPGAFAQFAYWIANHGRLPVPVSPAAFGGFHPGLTFSSFGFASHGAAVAPGLTAGLPIVLGAGLWAHSVTGATVISPLLGALAVLAVGGLTGRLAGPQWAPAGALLLALTVPEIYTSRSAFSETLAQALLFGGLCLVVDSFSAHKPVILAALGGVTLGLTVLAGAGFLLVLLPAIPVAGGLLAARRRQAIPLAAGLVGGVAAGLGAAPGLDPTALSSTTPSLVTIGIIAAGFAVLTAACVTVVVAGPVREVARKLPGKVSGLRPLRQLGPPLGRLGPPLRRLGPAFRWLRPPLRRLAPRLRPVRWLPGAVAALVLLAAIGLAIRPYVQKVRGPASPYVAALQRLEELPVDPGRLYAENSLYWVIWYLGVPALLLGFIGLAMITRRGVRALLTRSGPDGSALTWALPAAVIGWGTFAVLWQPGTVPDQPWASRKLVPVILPGLVVLAVWVAAWLISRAHARGAGLAAVAIATACFVVALGVPPAAITFGIELSHPSSPATRLALSGLAFRQTGEGQVGAVARLCGAIPPHSSVLLLDKPAARAFTQVVRGTCGVPAGVVTGAGPSQVATVIGGIERSGWHPALLATRASELASYGVSPRLVVSLATQDDSHLLTRPPTSTWPVRYTLWMSTPGQPVAGS